MGVEDLDGTAAGLGAAADAVDEDALRADGTVVADRTPRLDRERAVGTRTDDRQFRTPSGPEGPHPDTGHHPARAPSATADDTGTTRTPDDLITLGLAHLGRSRLPFVRPPRSRSHRLQRQPGAPHPRTHVTWRGSSQPSFHLCQANRSGARANWLPMRSQSPTWVSQSPLPSAGR